MEEIAKEGLRVLKPGGHCLVWAIPRTSHWTATAWENAGFECRDRISHIFGSGFPKSLNVGLAIQKQKGIKVDKVERTRPDGKKTGYEGASFNTSPVNLKAGEIIDEEAKQHEGWGTALKPAMEDWWLFRKPLEESTVAGNVLKYGTGGINIDGCRVVPENQDD
jgi:hypothetical protein